MKPSQAEILQAVADERERQDARWGQQNHPWRHSDTATIGQCLGRNGSAREVCGMVDHLMTFGRLTYADILLEEVAEAIEGRDVEHIRLELIQVAAVAVAAIESLDRNSR